MNNIKFDGYNYVNVQEVTEDAFSRNVYVGLDMSICEKIDSIDTKASIGEVDELRYSMDCQLSYFKQENESLKTQMKELRKILANINTRLSNIIAKEQVKEFYAKSAE